MRRFRPRTLLLMVVALVAFIRLWVISHQKQQQTQAEPPVVTTTPRAPEEPPACRTLDRALEGVMRGPSDPEALARVRQQLDACPQLPARACALGAALDARSPLDAGTTPLRELLDALCQRCPEASNPCVEHVTRSVMGLAAGRTVDQDSLRWHLEHAERGQGAACSEVVRSLLVPAALFNPGLTPAQKQALARLAPVCAREGLLPENVLHAAVVQGEVPALAELARAPEPAGESTRLVPNRVVGAPGGEKAFDGQEATSVELTLGPKGLRWEREGVLSAVFNPPVKQLRTLRVRASGPGALRAIIRTEGDVGLADPESGTSFVHPTACRFRGTGQWESCELKVPLLDVEALSIFPENEKLTLSEVELRGAR